VKILRCAYKRNINIKRCTSAQLLYYSR